MSKTHTEDNIQLDTVKALMRTAHKLGLHVVSNPKLTMEKVTTSSSVFELADSIRLGRSATRRALAYHANALSDAIERAEDKGDK
jgi:hypothetical protein